MKFKCSKPEAAVCDNEHISPRQSLNRTSAISWICKNFIHIFPLKSTYFPFKLFQQFVFFYYQMSNLLSWINFIGFHSTFIQISPADRIMYSPRYFSIACYRHIRSGEWWPTSLSGLSSSGESILLDTTTNILMRMFLKIA